MESRGCTPVEVLSVLEFHDRDLAVRCLALALKHISGFAPQCRDWEIQVIPFCQHHPSNIYPALGVYDAHGATYEEIERLGVLADDWMKAQTLGWLLEESRKITAPSWNELKGQGQGTG